MNDQQLTYEKEYMTIGEVLKEYGVYVLLVAAIVFSPFAVGFILLLADTNNILITISAHYIVYAHYPIMSIIYVVFTKKYANFFVGANIFYCIFGFALNALTFHITVLTGLVEGWDLLGPLMVSYGGAITFILFGVIFGICLSVVLIVRACKKRKRSRQNEEKTTI